MLWFDRPSAASVYAVYNPLPIAAAIPEARQLPDGRIVVRSTLENLQKLRRLDLPTIQPMDFYYDWPIQRGRTPLPHQRVMSNFMALHPHCFNLSDMGTMKTLATLWAAEYVMLHYPPGECRCAIFTTKSTMDRVWADELFNNFLGRRKVVVVQGDADKRQRLLGQPADFYILNHDGAKIGGHARKKDGAWDKVAQQLRDRTDLKIAVIDEVGAFRDATTDRSKIMREIVVPKDYLWALTGTPTPNGPTDAYGLARLVNGAYGESFKSFRDRTMQQVSSFKWVPRAGSKQTVAEILSPSVRFASEDCVQLPPTSTSQRMAPLSPDQTKYLNVLKREALVSLNNGAQITAANEAVLRNKAIQIACGAVYDAQHKAHYIDNEGRLKVLREVIEGSAKKVIVFAPLTSVVEMLKVAISKWTTVEAIYGEVSDRKRSEIFRAFQSDPNPFCIVADPGTMAHGLTLVAASTVCWFAPTDKTETYIQANKRVHRPGQKNETFVVQIAATALEREIYRRVETNQSLQGAVLKLLEGKE